MTSGQSAEVIKLAKAKYPGKPIKTLVLTHHHMDHTGGMRGFVAEGASVIVPAPDKAYFEEVIKRAHTIEPDAQQKAMKPANVQEVKDTLSLKDDTVEINLYNIPNPHVDGFLLVHVVKENVLFVTDLVSPRGTDRPQSRHGRSRRCAEEAQHHQRDDCRWSRRDRQAGRHRPRTGGELTRLLTIHCSARLPGRALFLFSDMSRYIPLRGHR